MQFPPYSLSRRPRSKGRPGTAYTPPSRKRAPSTAPKERTDPRLRFNADKHLFRVTAPSLHAPAESHLPATGRPRAQFACVTLSLHFPTSSAFGPPLRATLLCLYRVLKFRLRNMPPPSTARYYPLGYFSDLLPPISFPFSPA